MQPGSPSSEFVALCASILADGEVSADEAYDLAEWLNEHPAAATEWPGSELIQPLQEIWADGQVDTRELHRLMRLLISVQREWAQRHRNGSTNQGDELLGDFREITDARLPSVPFKTEIPSRTRSGIFYNVDLTGPACSCPDWRGRRSRLPNGHLTRCCKHVFDAYAQVVDRLQLDPWLEGYVTTGWPSARGTEWELLTYESKKILFSTPDPKGWANIFAPNGGSYARYGFNTLEDRWAYGEFPSCARTVCSAMYAFSRSSRQSTSFAAAEPVAKFARPETKRSFPWIAFASVAAGLISLAVLVAVYRTRAINHIDTTHVMSPLDEVSPSEPTPRALAANTPKVTPPVARKADVAPAIPWTTTTRKAVRTLTYRGEVVIPKGEQLRVIARTSSDVMVSYKGMTVTIPVSATDLH